MFVEVYTEIVIAREQYGQDTAQANKRVQEILAHAGMTEAMFRERFRALASQPEKLYAMLDSARHRARRIAEEESKREAERARKQHDDSVRTAHEVQPPQKQVR
ncbi:MAG: hypothetical protein RML40_07515 [Bacteroidota bacterium]|nr:hypothetical protein [Candidatus Kapabacteria bacterium]MDW8220362.1 hypothetical protein [Bacteroidota bacterium]